MKIVMIQGDGMGDFLARSADQPTPLEAAFTPNFDHVAGSGILGLLRTIPHGLPPGSDVGNLSLFGYDPLRYYTGRSPLEAAAMGVHLAPEDVAFRMNMITLAGQGGGATMADFSAGHIDSASAAQLVSTLNAELGDEAFQFYPGVSYRHMLVWRGGMEQMELTPPHDITNQAVAPHLPKGEGSAELLRIMETSAALFAEHPLNKARRQGGEAEVSQVWFWGQGRAPAMPSFHEQYGLRGACISAVDLVRGVAVYAGFDLIEVPGATGYIDTDYAAKGRYALTVLADHDVVFVHIEAPDEAGHMGSVEEKIKAIESIDRLIVGPLLKNLPALGPFKLFIGSDHATPPSTRTHSRDPVPFAMASAQELGTESAPKKYGESAAGESGILIENGWEIVSRLMAD